MLLNQRGSEVRRFFFNIYNGEAIYDKTGIEMADKREVRLHMLSTALSLFAAEEHHSHEWLLEALDERGRIVATLTFGIDVRSQHSS